MSDDNQQMDEREYIKAAFFASDAEFDASIADRRAVLAQRQQRSEGRREMRDLKRIAAMVQRMEPRARRALIFWLADAFLGLKLWGSATTADAVSDRAEGS